MDRDSVLVVDVIYYPAPVYYLRERGTQLYCIVIKT